VKPVRLIKKLGAAVAVGLIALGIVAGTAAASPVSSGDLSSDDGAFSVSSSGDLS
jgi:hypothetical protein